MNKIENNLTYREMHALKFFPKASQYSTVVTGDIVWLILVSTAKLEFPKNS